MQSCDLCALFNLKCDPIIYTVWSVGEDHSLKASYYILWGKSRIKRLGSQSDTNIYHSPLSTNLFSIQLTLEQIELNWINLIPNQN